MDAEVAPIPKMTQRLIWDPAQADLQGRAVVDDRGDIAGHTLCNLADIRMKILRDRHVNPYQCLKPVEMNHALAMRARHRWIDLRDNGARDAQDRGREIHGHSEADKAPGIRRGNLKQCHVDREPSARQQSRYLFQRDGHVVQLPAARQTAHFAADEKCSMAVSSSGRACYLRQCWRREEANELKVCWARLHRLQPGKQSAWGSTSGGDIDAGASPNRCQSTLGGNDLRTDVNGVRPRQIARSAYWQGPVP